MITLSKLAKLTHVSVSTVSKAFSMSSEVNPETREMIFEAAKKLGCFKKFYKAKYPKLVIAVICPEFRSRYYSVALYFIQKRLSEYNCEICVASTDFSESTEAELLEYYNRYTSVDGIIIINGKTKVAEDMEIPVATIDSAYNNGVISVTSDFIPCIREAVDYFVENGVTDIGFIGETNTDTKLAMVCGVIEEKLGKTDSLLISVTDLRFEEGGFDAMEKFFESGKYPRAIICAYDHMATGAISCICEHGLRVPEDIAVMGMNDIGGSGYLNPPLSSINTHLDKVCNETADAMMEYLSGTISEKRITVLPEVIFRKSTEIKKR